MQHIQFRNNEEEQLPKNRLNILFVCPYVPHTGVHAGAGRMHYIIREIAKRHDVSVITFYEHEGEKQYLTSLREFCRGVIGIVRTESLNDRDWFHIQPLEITRVFGNAEMRAALASEVQSGAYDIIQCEYLFTGHLIQQLDIPSNAKLILSDHEALARKQWRDIQNSSILEKPELFIRWMKMLSFSEKIYKQFHAIAALTEEDRSYIHSYVPGIKTIVAPMGVDIDFFQPNALESEPNTLLFVGNFKHFPNVDAMIFFCSEIFPRLKAKNQALLLYIAGSNPPEEVQRLGEQPGITVTGSVEDLRPYYNRATVVVVPVRLGGGMRGKVLEAWAMNKPVVSTSVGAEGLHCEHGREIMIADSANEFIDSLTNLMTNPAERTAISERGYTRARQEFTWDSVARIYEQLYYKQYTS